jgi:capsular polysaccharide biosynthesis protein
MEIKDVIRIIAKWWIMIISFFFVSVLCAGVVSFYYLQNVYESSAVMIISSPRDNQDLAQLTLNDYTLNIKLVNSYRVLCKTDKILNQVITETKLPLTVKGLSDKITVSADSETEIIRISVQDYDPSTSALIANAVASVFVREIPQIMRMDNVQVIDKALPNQVPVKPNKMMIMAVAGLLGLMVSLGIAFLIEYFDVRIKTSEQLSALLDVPVLGTIPHMQEKAGKNGL